MSEYQLRVEGFPVAVGRALVPGAPVVSRRLAVALGAVRARVHTFLAAGQLGSGDAVERARWTGARC